MPYSVYLAAEARQRLCVAIVNLHAVSALRSLQPASKMVGTAFSLPERAASERGCVGGCGLGQGSLEPSTEYYSQFRSSLLGSAPGAYRADKGQASMALLAPPSSQAPAKDSGRIKPRAASLGWIQGSCRSAKAPPLPCWLATTHPLFAGHHAAFWHLPCPQCAVEQLKIGKHQRHLHPDGYALGCEGIDRAARAGAQARSLPGCGAVRERTSTLPAWLAASERRSA